MNIYVLRHGQTNYNVEGRFQGQIDIELNETGREQIRKAANALKQIRFEKIFVSPLQRTRETATILNKGEFTIEPRIIERSFGTLEGNYSIENYEDKIEEFKIESVTELEKRVKSFVIELLKQNEEQKNILIVTHEGIAQIINKNLNMDMQGKDWKEFRLGNGHYIKYEIPQNTELI